jgi:cytochrome P450
MDLLKSLLKFETSGDRLRLAIKVVGAYFALKTASYLRWRNRINRSIPGPPDSLLMGACSELYQAGLNDFWGFNPRLFKSLFSRYGKMVRFWLPGSGLFICCSDVDDVAELNKKCTGRPDLTEVLLPYLGKDNLLFQKGAMIKNLRMRYGAMVNDKQTLQLVHDVTLKLVDERFRGWSSASTVDLHDALDTVIYDIMGQSVFGGTWSDGSRGKAIRAEHLYLIKWSSRYGMEVLKDPTWGNFFNCFADLRRYFASMRKLRSICGEMIRERRKAIEADPKKYENDRTALSMLVLNPKSATDPSPFFSDHLAVSTCIGFLNGAYDTTHSTSFWIFYHLARYPAEQERLAADILERCGTGSPTLEALRASELLEAFVKESMRLRPTVPIGMRVPEDDVTIDGVHIPKGTCILPFLDYHKGSEKHWGPEPEKFRPERFVGDSADAIKARNKFDRFGGYARMCVGMTFAQAELRALVARVLQLYKIELADPNMAEAEMIYEAGVYQPKEHFHFVFKAR